MKLVKPRIIHIHRGRIDGNRKNGTSEPPIIVRKGTKREAYGNVVQIGEHTRIVYSPDKPLDCGARVWIETTEKVEVVQ